MGNERRSRLCQPVVQPNHALDTGLNNAHAPLVEVAEGLADVKSEVPVCPAVSGLQ